MSIFVSSHVADGVGLNLVIRWVSEWGNPYVARGRKVEGLLVA
jgi:hypothetical protein